MTPTNNQKGSLSGSLRIKLQKAFRRSTISDAQSNSELNTDIRVDHQPENEVHESTSPEDITLWQRVKRRVRKQYPPTRERPEWQDRIQKEPLWHPGQISRLKNMFYQLNSTHVNKTRQGQQVQEDVSSNMEGSELSGISSLNLNNEAEAQPEDQDVEGSSTPRTSKIRFGYRRDTFGLVRSVETPEEEIRARKDEQEAYNAATQFDAFELTQGAFGSRQIEHTAPRGACHVPPVDKTRQPSSSILKASRYEPPHSSLAHARTTPINTLKNHRYIGMDIKPSPDDPTRGVAFMSAGHEDHSGEMRFICDRELRDLETNQPIPLGSRHEFSREDTPPDIPEGLIANLSQAKILSKQERKLLGLQRPMVMRQNSSDVEESSGHALSLDDTSIAGPSRARTPKHHLDRIIRLQPSYEPATSRIHGFAAAADGAADTNSPTPAGTPPMIRTPRGSISVPKGLDFHNGQGHNVLTWRTKAEDKQTTDGYSTSRFSTGSQHADDERDDSDSIDETGNGNDEDKAEMKDKEHETKKDN